MTKRLTANFSDDEAEWIEQLVEEGEFESKSKAIQELVRRAREDLPELEDRVDELEEKKQRRENRIEQLEKELSRRSQLEEEIADLPAKIKDEMSYQERRRRKLDQASIAQRFKWKVTGVPVGENEKED